MANPSSNYPESLHTKVDVSAFTTSPLGQTTPNHVELEGQQEEEIYAVQQKIGIGSSLPSVTGTVLTCVGEGESEWMELERKIEFKLSTSVIINPDGIGLSMANPYICLSNNENYLEFEKDGTYYIVFPNNPTVDSDYRYELDTGFIIRVFIMSPRWGSYADGYHNLFDAETQLDYQGYTLTGQKHISFDAYYNNNIFDGWVPSTGIGTLFNYTDPSNQSAAEDGFNMVKLSYINGKPFNVRYTHNKSEYDAHPPAPAPEDVGKVPVANNDGTVSWNSQAGWNQNIIIGTTTLQVVNGIIVGVVGP